MKKVLKRSEIIERLHQMFGCPVSIVRFSTIDLGDFDKTYFMIIHYRNIYEIVKLHLLYGWVEFEFRNSHSDLKTLDLEYSLSIRLKND